MARRDCFFFLSPAISLGLPAEQLKSAGGQKPFFAEQVKEVQAKIEAKEKELEVCLRKSLRAKTGFDFE